MRGRSPTTYFVAAPAENHHHTVMPRSSSHSTLARQWEILRKLPTRPPGMTAADLTAHVVSEGFESTKRTVERDLIELSRIFAIRCNNVSPPFGWYYMPGHEPVLPEFDLPEALSLHLAEGVLRASLPSQAIDRLESRFRRAKETLDAPKRTPQSRWRNKVRFVPQSLPMIAPSVRPGVLREIQAALLAEKVIVAKYQSFDSGSPKQFTLHPLALVHSGPLTHLVATAFDFTDVRHFALHRFASVEVGTEPARRPKGFDIDRYIESGAMGFGEPHPIKLKAHISEKLARYLRETPLSKSQKITSDSGAFDLRADVKDTWQLRWWILGQSPEITVLEPEYLADQLQGTLKAAIEGYQEIPKSPDRVKGKVKG